MVTTVDTPKSQRLAAALPWLPAVAVSMLYPLALHYFVEGIHTAQGGSSAARILGGLSAVVMLALAMAPPALALKYLYAIRLDTRPGTIAVRRLLHLVAAVPPVYLLCIRVAGIGSLGGNATAGIITWWSVWTVLSIITWNACRRAAAPVSITAAAGTRPAPHETGSASRFLTTLNVRSRRIHFFAVIAVLASFLILHLANHLFALWSVPAQRAVMVALRAWYRSIWMEPVILALFVVAAGAGLVRLGRLLHGQSDGWRVLQTASGIYLVFFLVSHVWAALGARFHDIDTDWAFASGGNTGMLATGLTAGVLLYYVYSLLAVGAHAGLGLRMVLLSRKVPALVANRALRLVVGCSTAASALIVAALLGVRLGG